MTKFFAALAAATFSAGLPGTAAAQATEQPRWYLDGSSARCALTRKLEGTPGPAAFILRTVPGSGSYDVMIAAPDIDKRPGQVRLRFGTGQAQDVRATVVSLPGRLGEALAIPYLPAFVADEFARAGHVELADGRGRVLGRWNLPAASRAARALGECEAEKQIEWGADPASVAEGASPPRVMGEADSWLTARDLGIADLTTPAVAAAVFRLSVAPDGRASGCSVLESAGSVEIDRGACRVLARRARFEPARDSAGNPVHSVAIYRVAAQMGTASNASWGGKAKLTRTR